MTNEIEAIREQNRRRYPEEAAFIDEVRRLFGDASVTYLGEPRHSTKIIAETIPLIKAEPPKSGQ